MARPVLFAVFALALALPAGAAEPAAVVKLWPGKAPGETADIGPEGLQPNKAGDTIKRLEKVSEPTVAVYKPAKDKDTGCAVVVAPGGGYSILAIEHEGTAVCDWLNELGVTAVLLKYRVPNRPGLTPANKAAVQDAQRAVSIVRSRAKEWGIDPHRVGMLGFSAGGNLTAWSCCHPKREYDAVDAADKEPFKPDFAVLIYPGGVIDKGGALKPEFAVTKETPPMCFVHSTDDPVSVENSTALYLALKKAGVPAETHFYSSGGHGYGINKVPHPCASWPARVGDWMTARGVLTAGR